MPDNLNNQDREKWTKIMFGVLAFFGVATLLLGVLNISKLIDLPVADRPAGEESLGALSQEQITAEQLRQSDNDGDGLSDYDELYVYGTSMYLADSDSDGYSDKEEIDGGYDPNCPKGIECRSTGGQESGQEQVPADNGDFLPAEGAGGQLPVEATELLNQFTPQQVRELILESGQISAEELDKIDDVTLMEFFRQTLIESQGQNN